MDMHWIVGTITMVYRPRDKATTADVKLINGDEIKGVPFMLPTGTDEKRFGHVKVDCGVEMVLMKNYGSEWLIIGEVSQKRIPHKQTDDWVMLHHITDALWIINRSMKQQGKTIKNIGKAVEDSGYNIYNNGLGFQWVSSGKIKGQTLDTASIVLAYGLKTQLGGLQVKQQGVDIQNRATTFLDTYPSALAREIEAEEALFPTVDC